MQTITKVFIKEGYKPQIIESSFISKSLDFKLVTNHGIIENQNYSDVQFKAQVAELWLVKNGYTLKGSIKKPLTIAQKRKVMNKRIKTVVTTQLNLFQGVNDAI